MADDLDLDSERYSVALVVFFATYVFFEVPSNMILVRSRPSVYLPTIMAMWGAVTLGMAFSPNYQVLIGLRVLMGTLEAGFAPGVLLLLSSWYKKEEQSRRFAVYISAAILSGAFGGLLAGSITTGLKDAHGIAGWRWLFIVEGVGTIGVAAIALFVLPDFPATTSARKFNEAEKNLAVLRLQNDDQQVRNDDEERMGEWAALKESLVNWKTWAFVIGYMVCLHP
jgi:MFS family permease